MRRVFTVLLTVAMVFMVGMPVMAQGLVSPIAIEPIRIGVYLPMTGEVAYLGQRAWDGILAAKEMQPSLVGREVKLFLEDTKSDRNQSVEVVEHLIRWEKVSAIIGEVISSDSIAAGPLGDKYQVPMVTPGATNPRVTEGKKYYFRVCFSDTLQGEVAANLAVKTLKAKTAAVIIDISQDYCIGLANYFVKSFVKLGGEVLNTTYIGTGEKDFRTKLATVQAAKPDMIYAPDYYTEVALLARQAKELGINVPILSGDGAETEEVIKLGGKAVEGMYVTGLFSEGAITTKLGKDFQAFYEKKYNRGLDASSATGADAYFVLLDAMKRADSTAGPELREALAHTKDFQGVSGTISIGEDGNAVKDVVIKQVKDGKFVYVTSISP